MFERHIELNEQYKAVKKKLKELGWKFRKHGKKVRIYKKGIGHIDYYIDFIYLYVIQGRGNQLDNMIFNNFEQMKKEREVISNLTPILKRSLELTKKFIKPKEFKSCNIKGEE